MLPTGNQCLHLPVEQIRPDRQLLETRMARHGSNNRIDTKESNTMKKIMFAPAMADIGHHDWVNNVTNPTAQVPHVDTTVHQSH
jgi:hypothetical protein